MIGGKRDRTGKDRKPPSFNDAGGNEVSTDVSTNVSTEVPTEVPTNPEPEQLEHPAVQDIPEVVVTKSAQDRLEALKKKHEEEMKAKKKAQKKQISTYLEPKVLKEYEKYGSNKGDKQRLINDLLKAYFGIED